MGTIIPFVPLAKSLVKYLPKIADRPYSKVEAAFCVMVDYDDQKPVTIRGYAKLWQWNKKTVLKFLTDHGAMIIYPKNTGDYKNQRGSIGILKRDQSGTNQGPIRFINNKDLSSNRDQSGTNQGPIRDQSVPPTIEPKPKPKPKQRTSKIFAADSLEMQISNYLYAVLLKSDSDLQKPKMQNWCKEIDLLIRIDKAKPEDIKTVINHAHDPKNSTGKFSWIPNLRSPKKLREHFKTILIQSRQYKTGKGSEKSLSELVAESKVQNFDLELTDFEEVR